MQTATEIILANGMREEIIPLPVLTQDLPFNPTSSLESMKSNWNLFLFPKYPTLMLCMTFRGCCHSPRRCTHLSRTQESQKWVGIGTGDCTPVCCTIPGHEPVDWRQCVWTAAAVSTLTSKSHAKLPWSQLLSKTIRRWESSQHTLSFTELSM